MSRAELHQENLELKTELILVKEENAQLKKMIFGAKRERFEAVHNPMQGKLFEEEKAQSQVVAKAEEKIEKKTKKSSRKGIKRNRFPSQLERETTIVEPLAISPADFEQIGKDVTELLAYRPATLFVKEIIRPRYVDQADESKGVFQAPIPARTIPKGMVDESLIAELISEKIQFHTPIHRFSKKLKQAGVDFISGNNLYNWFHTGAESLLPLYHLLVEDILAQGYLQADETRMIVLAKNKKGAAHRGQMWAFMAPTIKAVVFNYEPTRSTQSARTILDDFSGKLQVDGYSVYDCIGKRKDINLSFCLAHSRRKFYDAKDNAPKIANYFLEKVQLLYQIEQKARDKNLTSQQRLDLRTRKAIPILNQIGEWLTLQYTDRTILPKSLIKKAIDYTFKRWKGLCAYAYDGDLEIDNNLVENTIRPIALGRKNYMFAGSHDAAQNLAVLYSIVGTCLKHNINVYKYLHWVLKKVATNKVTPDALNWLPHRIDPEILKTFDL